jgi:type III restriction enzyme
MVIWLTEVAPHVGKTGERFLEHLVNTNNDANPELMRLALKLATGAGKTTVMAMLIAWQAINAARHPQTKKFTRGFLVVAAGLTIKDRLRVLQPNDPDSYYKSRELVPGDMLDEVNRAKIVITNYHAFKLRERIDLSKGGRSLLQGRGEELNTLETEGHMLQRVMPDLMGIKNILVLNDEAHHCYRQKAGAEDEEELKGDEKREAEKNKEAARVWISGLEAVNRKLGVARVIDLSATPFFLSGSGYAEGTLFPWTLSDFSLMDAIECGIVKLPRVPVADNIPGAEMPMFRNLWEHIGKKMPKKGRGKDTLDPLSLPPQLQTALEALCGHYEKTFELWQKAEIRVPPCFIVVCNNTSTSKLVYDYISGFLRDNDDGSKTLIAGRLEFFRNFDEHGNPFPRPYTLLIDSEQLESGEGLDENFRLHIEQGFVVTSHAAQAQTVDEVIVSVPIDSFSQANEAQFYVSMSRGREAMHLFTDSKVALREAVTRPSSRLSPIELINSEEIGLLQSASKLRSFRNGHQKRQNMNQEQERGMER